MPRLFIEHLTVIDYAYLDNIRGLVGNSLIVDLELDGALDAQSMVCDFGTAKHLIKRCIDETVDHKLLVPALHPEVTARYRDGLLEIEFTDQHNSTLIHRSPENSVCLLEDAAVTINTITNRLLRAIAVLVPDNVSDVVINLRQESTPTPYFHYCHGLKKHYGNCQRIAHGHRSRIEIHENGERNPEWEHWWAEKWNDVYIATTADLVDRNELRVHLAYDALQGRFELEVEADRCYFIDVDSTVEHLAQHIATELHKMRPRSTFQVKAFEGVNKGAVAHT